MYEYQAWIIALVHGVFAPVTAIHALLFKRNPQAALGWIAVCIMLPLGGPLLYVIFGVNRVRMAARQINRRAGSALDSSNLIAAADASAILQKIDVPENMAELVRASSKLSSHPMLYGNVVDVLHNGEQAFPAMLEAIDGARRRVFLTTYLFETNRTGRAFVAALGRAVERGVDVRVIVDGVGELYNLPWASRLLGMHGVRVARFLPPRLWPPMLHINLRNHRKILVTDGQIAFTGGMNIGDRHLAADAADRKRVVDVHFRLRGPVVTQIEGVFLTDWGFVTGDWEEIEREPAAECGNAMCRTIVEGPVRESDPLATLLMSAVCAARERVTIVTPYFLPSPELVGALQATALRGIVVEIILPGLNNQPLVHWASRHMLPALLRFGVHVFYQPPPFAHTKLFIVDGRYLLIGSANIDPRSLRLNFELAVEIFETATVTRVSRHVDQLRAAASELTLKDINRRGPIARVRDALCWLASPYL